MNSKLYKGKAKRLLLLMLPVLALTSCVFSDDLPEPEPAGDGSIVFTLNMPASTRSLSDIDENEVREIDVLVFQNSGNGGKFQSRKSVYAADITPGGANGNQKSFSVTLQQGSFDLVVFANAGGAIDALTLNGKTKAAFLAELTEALPAGGKWIADESATGYRPFPMWGDVGVINITSSTSLTGTSSVTMTRMLSRVDVSVSALNFQLTSVDVYNYNTKGYTAPFTASWDATGKKAIAPSVPAGVRLLGPISYSGTAINSIDNECVQEIYIFEAENLSGSAAKESSDRTCLVIGGVYDADGDGNFDNNGTTFYRVDFSTGSGAAESFMDVLRNHKYTVDIRQVADDGHDTSLSAFNGDARLTAEITPWNLAIQGVIGDGQYWLTTSKDDIVFDFHGGTEIVVAETNYNITTQGFPKGVVVNAAEIKYTPDVAAGEEWLTLSDSGVEGALKRTINIIAEQNLENAERSAKIYVKAGNFTKVINVKQTMAPPPIPPDLEDGGNTTNIAAYFGAFWRAGQTGERIIKIPTTAVEHAGKWAVQVLEHGDFLAGDIVFLAGGSEDPNIYTAMPGDAEDFQVNSASTVIGGTATTASGITFRIGLKSKWNSSHPNWGDGSRPVRYARILVSFGTEYHYTRVLWLRQGEADDYLIHPDDVGSTYRDYVRKFSPYNLIASNITENDYTDVAVNGGTWTAYPSQAGSIFQWAGASGYERRAWHPSRATLGIWSGDIFDGSLTWDVGVHETCPTGYRRPVSTDGTLAKSEFAQSLLADASIDNLNNSVTGYLADGFFDRLTIDYSEGAIPNTVVKTVVAKGTKDAAYIGRFFYNSKGTSPRKNASIFFPINGVRRITNGGLVEAGYSVMYFTSTAEDGGGVEGLGYDAFRAMLFRIDNTNFHFAGYLTGRASGATVRCVRQ